MNARLSVPLLLAAVLAACDVGSSSPPTANTNASLPSSTSYVQAASDVEAGRYLITVGSCNDCHTHGFMEQGFAIPESEWLTGTPIGFRGPWGTSYPKNLRLTVQQLTEDQWVTRLQSTGLPPMPWMNVNLISEVDARAIYRYLRSLGPAGELAPPPVPPGQEPTTPYFDFMPQHMERLGAPPADTTST